MLLRVRKGQRGYLVEVHCPGGHTLPGAADEVVIDGEKWSGEEMLLEAVTLEYAEEGGVRKAYIRSLEVSISMAGVEYRP